LRSFGFAQDRFVICRFAYFQRKNLMKHLTKYLPKNINLTPRLRYPVLRLLTLIVIAGVVGVATPALAADGPGAAFDEIVTSITELIQNITLIVGVLGLVIWGFGKVARPLFPEISGLTQQYIPNLLIGVVVVFTAAEIVDMVAGAVGAGG
jgi:type IV secretory pathway VirB2 component (pilin)